MPKQADKMIDLTQYEVTRLPPDGFEGPETAKLMAFWREVRARCPGCLEVAWDGAA